MNLSEVVESLVEERGLDRDKVIEIVCDGIRIAYEKKFEDYDFRVVYNKKAGSTDVYAEKQVVQVVEDDVTEVSLKKAKTINPTVQIGDFVNVPFEEKVGRIEILTARQIIAGRIRELEAMAVYKEFLSKEGTIVSGTVHKRERGGYAVTLGDSTAFLPVENYIPDEVVRVGYPIRALLREVLQIPRGGYQLILDRTGADFVKTLIELEIPEVYEGVVEIKKIVRRAGYKTKVAVIANSKEIDPVGTCVGVGGARIKPILKELGQEKVDLVAWTENLELFVKSSLKPAEIDKVELVGGRAIVWLSEDQRSFAIGKGGQNIALASQLAEIEIQLQELAADVRKSFGDNEDAEEESGE